MMASADEKIAASNARLAFTSHLALAE